MARRRGVAALPDVSLAFVGMSPPAWLQEVGDERVRVTGPVPDVRPYLAAASVMPVPVRAGPGTRLKVLEHSRACCRWSALPPESPDSR